MAFPQRLVTSQQHINMQLGKFPGSRYMGSKQAILPFIYDVMKELEFTTVLNACSGSGAVSYLFKSMNKAVTSNDALHFCYHIAQACVANNTEMLSHAEVEMLLVPHPEPGDFIARTFNGLYFTDTENQWLDNTVAHIFQMPSPFKQSLAFAGLVHACLRRRPRGIFTYTGSATTTGDAICRSRWNSTFVMPSLYSMRLSSIMDRYIRHGTEIYFCCRKSSILILSTSIHLMSRHTAITIIRADITLSKD